VQQLVQDLFDEAADYVEVVRRLWDSWEDDAEIRDVATGRFIDRDKLHYIDFEGRFFASRARRSRRGRRRDSRSWPRSVTRASRTRLIARSTRRRLHHPARCRRRPADHRRDPRGSRRPRGRAQETVHVFADLTVFLDDDRGVAAQRKARLDDLAGSDFASDAKVFQGTPAELADLLLDWHEAGVAGFRLRPGALPHDLRAITRRLAPELQRRGAFRTAYESTTLRGLLGLPRPANRYAA
jgi:alkanesulfonate monooxygenase SsuD/methylene tetrahydromethanopterin reductase-like flavin-dependent oxidoreductase (luciferase family)